MRDIARRARPVDAVDTAGRRAGRARTAGEGNQAFGPWRPMRKLDPPSGKTKIHLDLLAKVMPEEDMGFLDTGRGVAGNDEGLVDAARELASALA